VNIGTRAVIRSPVPNFMFIGIICRSFGAKNPFFAPLCECNTGKKENKFEVYPKSLKELVETDVSTVVFVKFIEELIDFGWR